MFVVVVGAGRGRGGETGGVADFILLHILCVFETFHNNKVFKILSSNYV